MVIAHIASKRLHYWVSTNGIGTPREEIGSYLQVQTAKGLVQQWHTRRPGQTYSRARKAGTEGVKQTALRTLIALTIPSTAPWAAA